MLRPRLILHIRTSQGPARCFMQHPRRRTDSDSLTTDVHGQTVRGGRDCSQLDEYSQSASETDLDRSSSSIDRTEDVMLACLFLPVPVPAGPLALQACRSLSSGGHTVSKPAICGSKRIGCEEPTFCLSRQVRHVSETSLGTLHGKEGFANFLKLAHAALAD